MAVDKCPFGVLLHTGMCHDDALTSCSVLFEIAALTVWISLGTHRGV